MLLKVVLVGHPGSQKIVRASKYLTRTYMPDFEFTYLNYTGSLDRWSDYVAGFLSYLTDEHVIFALDDYLLADYIDIMKYHAACRELIDDVMCIKLCESTEQEHEEYPCTTQYTIWNRKYLIQLLNSPRINDPWQFEINGSVIMKESNIIPLHRPCLSYFTNSSISSRWDGVKLDGLKDEDLTYIKNNHLIK